MKINPNISVIIPNYNHAPFLKERINSILNQSYQDFEIIILDDNSTDNSKQVIGLYKDHPKVSYVVINERNSSSTFLQWNKGIELSKGKYIWIAESDDFSEPAFLQDLLSAIMNDKEIVLAYCQSNRVDSKGNNYGSWLDWTEGMKGCEIFNSSFSMDGKEFNKQFLLYKNVIPNASAVLFRKDAFIQTGGADPRIKYCSDWLTWLKILTVGKIFYSHQLNNSFRKHNKSVISSAFQQEEFMKKYDIKMRKAFNKFLDSFTNRELREINYDLYKQELRIEKDFCNKNNNPLKAFIYDVELFLTK